MDVHTYNPEDLHVMERSVLRRSDIIPAFGRPVESGGVKALGVLLTGVCDCQLFGRHRLHSIMLKPDSLLSVPTRYGDPSIRSGCAGKKKIRSAGYIAGDEAGANYYDRSRDSASAPLPNLRLPTGASLA